MPGLPHPPLPSDTPAAAGRRETLEKERKKGLTKMQKKKDEKGRDREKAMVEREKKEHIGKANDRKPTGL